MASASMGEARGPLKVAASIAYAHSRRVHSASALRYSPQQQCVIIALVKEAKFDRFYFLSAPKVGLLAVQPCAFV